MPIRQKIGIAETMPIRRSDKISLPGCLCALIVFSVIAFGSTTQGFAQDAPKPETQPSPSPAAMPPPGQAPPPRPAPIAPVALYNLLQRKSIVFPDIAYSTVLFSSCQKFESTVDNSISVNAIVWSLFGSVVGKEDDSP